jgi:hypothetical protein
VDRKAKPWVKNLTGDYVAEAFNHGEMSIRGSMPAPASNRGDIKGYHRQMKPQQACVTPRDPQTPRDATGLHYQQPNTKQNKIW